MFRTCACRAVVSTSSQAQSPSTGVKCLTTQLTMCALIFETSLRALMSDLRLFRCLQGGGVAVGRLDVDVVIGNATVTFESCSIIGNTALFNVRAQIPKFLSPWLLAGVFTCFALVLAERWCRCQWRYSCTQQLPNLLQCSSRSARSCS